MFFKQLYRYNKTLCIICLLALLSFVWINYKWGVVASPLSHYGMYSGKYSLQDTLSVIRVYANEIPIELNKLNFIERDILLGMPILFQHEQGINKSVFTTMHPYFKNWGMGAWMKSEKFQNAAEASEYNSWYKQKLEEILDRPIHSLAITTEKWIWKNKQPERIFTSPKQIID